MTDYQDGSQALFNPFASEEISPPYSEHWQAKRRVAQAIRDLTDVLVTSTPPTEELHAIAEKLEHQAGEFAKCKRLYGLLDFLRDGEHGQHGEVNHELNGVGGWSNPLSPGLNMWVEGDKAYGRLAVMCGWAADCHIVMDLPARAFTPPPKVASAVVNLVPLSKPRAEADMATLSRVVAAAFNQRRKMLRQSLKALGGDTGALLDSADIDPTRRAETLSIEEFAALARNVQVAG